MNTMLTAARTVLSKYVTFEGRASRSELWWLVLCVFIIFAVTQIIDGAVILLILRFEAFQEGGGQPLSSIIALLIILPNIAVGVRRMHDIGRSGWWLLIALIPIIGSLILLFFYIQPCEDGSNQFGPPQPPD